MLLQDTKQQTHKLNRQRLQELAAMPLQTNFQTIYASGYWGQNDKLPFYSGSGSHDADMVKPYITRVRQFLKSLGNLPVVVDLGCGDFAIGRQLVDLSSHYFACDIVKSLVDYNREHYQNHNTEFICLDATRDQWPAGDVLIVRQVLQHLSNANIQAITRQFDRYPYVVITEHIPEGDFRANRDKADGPDNRLRFNSGIDITAPPFSVSALDQEVLCKIDNKGDFGGIVQTTLYRMAT